MTVYRIKERAERITTNDATAKFTIATSACARIIDQEQKPLNSTVGSALQANVDISRPSSWLLIYAFDMYDYDYVCDYVMSMHMANGQSMPVLWLFPCLWLCFFEY